MALLLVKALALLLQSWLVFAQDPPYSPPALPPPPPPAGCPNGYPSSSGIIVDLDQKFQEMDGCGYSQAFQRAGWMYNALSPTNRDKVLDLLHDVKTGVGMSMYRIGIGSSPNSTRDWMNSIEPVGPSNASGTPTYVWDRNDSSQVWWAQEAQKRGCVYFYADSWSADGYMKTNGVDFNGQYLCGVRGTNCPSGNWMQHYANKLVQWAKYYQQEGINITHLGCVNEPDVTQFYASMLMDGFQFYDFIQILRPTVKAAFPNIQITWNDAAGWEQARKRFDDFKTAAGPTWERWYDQPTSHAYDQQPRVPFQVNKAVWLTEWAALQSPFGQPWFQKLNEGEGIVWANRLWNAFVNSNVSMMTYWIGAELRGAGDSLIEVLATDSFVVSSRLWAFAGFCRYVRPGSVRVAAHAVNTTYANLYLAVSAFSNPQGFATGDGKIAIQMINNGNTNATFPVEIRGVSSISNVTTYLLDNDHNLEAMAGLVQVTGPTVLNATVNAFSMVTLVVDY